MKNIFLVVLIINCVACSKFSEVNTAGGLEGPQNRACSSDNNCVARLAWDPNPAEEEITAYIIEYGEVSRNDQNFSNYEHSLEVNNSTSAKLEGLKKKTYYLSIRSKSGSEQSDRSEEIVLAPQYMKDN